MVYCKNLILLFPGKEMRFIFPYIILLFIPYNLLSGQYPVEQKSTITREIAVEKKQESFEINCILFQFDDYGLSKTATRQIDLVYKLLTRVRSANLVIIGHTDAIGNNKYNISLSQKRALSVQNYLIKKGINSKQLDVKWEGETYPVANNKNSNGTDNSSGRKFNRRVCFNFLNIPENVSVKYINNIPEYLKISY